MDGVPDNTGEAVSIAPRAHAVWVRVLLDAFAHGVIFALIAILILTVLNGYVFGTEVRLLSGTTPYGIGACFFFGVVIALMRPR